MRSRGVRFWRSVCFRVLGRGGGFRGFLSSLGGSPPFLGMRFQGLLVPLFITCYDCFGFCWVFLKIELFCAGRVFYEKKVFVYHIGDDVLHVFFSIIIKDSFFHSLIAV